jgi:hypothetical protein
VFPLKDLQAVLVINGSRCESRNTNADHAQCKGSRSEETMGWTVSQVRQHEVLKEFVDRESEANKRSRCSDPGHERSFVRQKGSA